MTIGTPARVLFGWKQDWYPRLQRSCNPQRHEISMSQFSSTDLSDFDAIVPLTLEDQHVLEKATPPWPALFVPKKVRGLCNDKLTLNQGLIDLGFGDLVPEILDQLPPDPGRQPVIIKARKGEWGIGTEVLDTVPTDDLLSKLSKGTHFAQCLVPGRYEYATHFLMHQGEARLCLTMEYDMGNDRVVKGRSHVPVSMRWLAETPAKPVLMQVLKAVNLSDGCCCFDYRMVDGKPFVFELNPRFGGSLAYKVTEFLDQYLACVAGQTPKGQASK